MMQVIDFHTHIFPRQKASAILSTLSSKADIPHFTDGTIQGLLNSMKKAGIHLALTSRITTRPEQVGSVNRWLHGKMQETIWPMAAIHPASPVNPEHLTALKAKGFKGIKLHLDYQGIDADDKRMYPVYEAAQASQMPVLFHAGLDRGLPPPVRATPKRLLAIHRQFPHLEMIAAHMGGEDNYDETEAYLLGTSIYLDTAFVLRIMEKRVLQRFFSKHSIERFLFGSDSPFTDQATELNFLLNLPFLTQDAKEKIAGRNAAGLLKIG
ncbi:MAG: amidohydrolase family protein [Pseudomonadota bacterium]